MEAARRLALDLKLSDLAGEGLVRIVYRLDDDAPYGIAERDAKTITVRAGARSDAAQLTATGNRWSGAAIAIRRR